MQLVNEQRVGLSPVEYSLGVPIWSRNETIVYVNKSECKYRVRYMYVISSPQRRDVLDGGSGDFGQAT